MSSAKSNFSQTPPQFFEYCVPPLPLPSPPLQLYLQRQVAPTWECDSSVMAKGKGEKKGGGAAAEEEQEQKLQAILLADSFNTNFRPISSDMPKVRAAGLRVLACCRCSTRAFRGVERYLSDRGQQWMLCWRSGLSILVKKGCNVEEIHKRGCGRATAASLPAFSGVTSRVQKYICAVQTNSYCR